MKQNMDKQMNLTLVPVGELLDKLGRRLGCEPMSLEGYFSRWAEDVVNVCAEIWNLKPQDLLLKTRNESVSHARMCALALLRHRNTEKSLHEIAAVLKVDHSSVLYAVKRVEILAKHEADFRVKFKTICRRLAFGDVKETRDASRRTSHIARNDSNKTDE